MDKSILVCFFFCFMTFHINFAVSESQDVDDQVRELATRLPTNEDQDDAGNHQDILPPLDKEYSDSDLSNGDVPELPSTLNIDTKSNNVDSNNSKSNVDIQIEPDSDSESELPPLFSDRFKYLVHHKLTDINVEDNLAESHANKDTELALLNSQPQSFDAESENTQDDETTISSIPGAGYQNDAEKGIIHQSNLKLGAQEQSEQSQELPRLPDDCQEEKRLSQVQHEYQPERQSKQFNKNSLEQQDKKQLQFLTGQLHQQEEQQQEKAEQYRTPSLLPRDNLDQLSQVDQQLSPIVQLNKKQLREWFPELLKTEQLSDNQQTDEVKVDDRDEFDDYDDSSDLDVSEESEESDQYGKTINSTYSDQEDEEVPQQLLEPKKQQLSLFEQPTHDESSQPLPTDSEFKSNAESDYVGDDDRMEDINYMDWINDFEDVFIDDFDASDNEKYNTNKTYDSTIRDDENKSDRDEETVTDGFGSQKVKTTNFEDDLYDDNYDSSDIDKDNDGDLDTNYENEETEGETDSAEEFVINASYEGGYELVEKTPSDSIGNDNDDLAETWDNSDSAGQAALDEISIDEVDSANNDSNSNESDVITEDKLDGRIIDVYALWRPLQDFNKDRTYTTDDWFDKENMDSEEEYPENEDNKEDIDAVKEEDQVGNLGERGNDDDDDEYYVTKWTHEDDDDEDDDNETEWDAETDDDVEEDFDELKNHVVNEPVDELAKKSKIPTAPTSMVLFYTWMIVAVLIVIVGISTYQSRCRGFKFPGIKTASNSKDDRKRLIEHEFV